MSGADKNLRNLYPFDENESIFARQSHHLYVEDMVLDKLTELIESSKTIPPEGAESIEGCSAVADSIISLWSDGMGSLKEHESLPKRDQKRQDSIFLRILLDVTKDFMKKKCRQEIQGSRQPMFTDDQIEHRLMHYNAGTCPMFDQSTWIKIWLQINLKLEAAKKSPSTSSTNDYLSGCQVFARMAFGHLASLTSTFSLERKGSQNSFFIFCICKAY